MPSLPSRSLRLASIFKNEEEKNPPQRKEIDIGGAEVIMPVAPSTLAAVVVGTTVDPVEVEAA